METSPFAAPGPEAWAEQFIASLHAHRDRAREFLAAQQTRLKQAEVFVEQELRRLEEELRSSINNNAELQQELAKTRSTAATLAQQTRQPGQLDWEAEKQRILAALEADFNDDDKARRPNRLKIGDVLRTTDEVVAAKDRDIQALKQRLEDQCRNGAAEVSDGVSVDQALNNDAKVREERERLKRLQEEWREKLRQAEVELALERAKIARQRAELEERRMARNASPEPPGATNMDGQAEQTIHGRWLAQLGLTAADREPRRHL